MRLACALIVVIVACDAVAPEVCRADDSKQAGWAGALIGVGVWRYAAMELGATGGYTFPFGLFLGAEVSSNHLGRSRLLLGKRAKRMDRYLAEFGYDVVIAEQWRVRPELSVGMQTIEVQVRDGGFSETTPSFAAGPGVAGLVRLGTFFAGLEGHLLFGPTVKFGDEATSFGTDLRAIGGLAF